MNELLGALRSLLHHSQPCEDGGGGLELVCTADLEAVERAAFFVDPSFPLSQSAAEWLKTTFPLPWFVRDRYEEQEHINGPYYVEDADGGVVAEGVRSRAHGMRIIRAWEKRMAISTPQ